MEGILDRLNTIQRMKSRSVRAFSHSIGLVQTSVDQQLKGVRRLSLSTIVAVCKTYPDISLDWLLLGIGDMKKSKEIVVNVPFNKTGDGSILNTGSVMGSITVGTSDLADENKKLNERVQELQERCDRLTDKLVTLA